MTSVTANEYEATQRVGIEWDPPACLQPVDEYLLSFQGAPTSYPILNVDQRDRVATFQGLLGQTVWIRVQGHTIFGWGGVGEVLVYLLPAPGAPPAVVMVASPAVLAEQSLFVSWSPVLYADRYYLLVTSNAAAGGGSSTAFVFDRTSGPFSVNRTVLGDLLANVVYRVQVAAGNADGNSSWSTYASGQTSPAEQPSKPVRFLIAAYVTETSVGLDWLPPLLAAGASPVTFYQVTTLVASTPVAVTEVPASQSPSAIIAGLATGVLYVFVVVSRSANLAGYAGVPAANVTAVPVAPPGYAPGDFRVSSIVDRNVTLSWTIAGTRSPSAATEFLVQVYEDGQVVFSKETPSIATGVQILVIPFLTPGVAYSFRLTPRNLNLAGYSSSPSATIDGVYVVGLPQPPFGLRVLSLGDSSVSLIWSASLTPPPATIFRTYWRLGQEQFSSGNMIETNVTIAVITGLFRGTLYDFRVFSGNIAGFNTAGSNIVSARPMPQPLPLSLISVTGITVTSVSITWAPSSLTFADSFLVQYSNFSVETTEATFTARDLTPGIPVKLTVFARSFNSLGYEQPGVSATVTPIDPPEPVTTLMVTNVTSDSVNIAFDPAQLVNATAYLVQFKRQSDGMFTNYSEYVCREDEQYLGSLPTCPTQISVMGLVTAVGYDFKVLLRNANQAGYGDGGNIVTAVPIFKPTLPATNLQVFAVTDSQVSIKFTFPQGLDSPTQYRVVYSESTSPLDSLESETSDFFASSVNVSDLILGQIYRFQIIGRNLNSQGYSDAVRSDPLFAGPYLKPSRVGPVTIVNFSGSSATDFSISVRWIPPLSGIVTLYRLEVANASAFDENRWISLSTIGLQPQFVLAGLTPIAEFTIASSVELPFQLNVSVIIRVSARNLNTDGYSDSAQAEAIPQLPPGFAPQAIFASNVTAVSICMSWTPSTAALIGNDTVTKYKVEGCSTNCGSGTSFPVAPVLGQKFYATGGALFFSAFQSNIATLHI